MPSDNMTPEERELLRQLRDMSDDDLDRIPLPEADAPDPAQNDPQQTESGASEAEPVSSQTGRGIQFEFLEPGSARERQVVQAAELSTSAGDPFAGDDPTSILRSILQKLNDLPREIADEFGVDA